MTRFDFRSFRTCGIAAATAAALAAGLLLAPPAHADAPQVLKVKAVENASGSVYKFEGLPSSLKGGIVQIN